MNSARLMSQCSFPLAWNASNLPELTLPRGKRAGVLLRRRRTKVVQMRQKRRPCLLVLCRGRANELLIHLLGWIIWARRTHAASALLISPATEECACVAPRWIRWHPPLIVRASANGERINLSRPGISFDGGSLFYFLHAHTKFARIRGTTLENCNQPRRRAHTHNGSAAQSMGGMETQLAPCESCRRIWLIKF